MEGGAWLCVPEVTFDPVSNLQARKGKELVVNESDNVGRFQKKRLGAIIISQFKGSEEERLPLMQYPRPRNDLFPFFSYTYPSFGVEDTAGMREMASAMLFPSFGTDF
ncbi:hypothetical protein AAG906_007420 [Vitis piasezkii]